MNSFFDALRTLRNRPGFTIVAVAMLALGIGINAAVFTVINAALFKGWPLVQRNDRIVQIATNGNGVFYPDFLEWSRAKSFSGMALPRGVHRTLSDGSGTPETHFATAVTANMFRVLGVKPILGRDFVPSDEQPGAEPVIILRYEVWAHRFAANPAIVGRRVRLDGTPATVIGVMPKGFSFPFPMKQDLWTALVPPANALRDEFGGPYAFARLADGVSLDQARTEMETIGRRLAREYPRTNQNVAPVVKGFEEWFIGASARTLYQGLWAAVGFVLLIVCANVANLLVTQAMGRTHEISIRLALGAGRWRIVRQFLVESLMLSAAGGALGWWIAKAGVRIYALSQVNDDVLDFTMDYRVLIWLIAISFVTGLLAGLATSTYLTKLNILSESKNESRSRLSGIFVSAEMALAVTLLASAGVVTRSFLNVYRAGAGVNTRNVLIMAVETSSEKYSNPQALISFYGNLETRLEAIPGLESVAFGTAAPAESTPRMEYELEESPTVDGQSRPTAAEMVVSKGYFRTLGAEILSGRAFDDSDRATSQPVAIVNRQFASRNWPGEVPLGKHLRLYPASAGKKPTPWITVVGIASDIVQNDRTRQTFDPLVYLSDAQHPGDGFVFVRASVASESLAAAVRRQIYAIDPELPVSNLMALSDRLDHAWAFERNVMVLLLLFAAVALLLASAGLYAAVSHSVSRRTREIGVRMAIGATDRNILKLVFSQGILPLAAGLTIGLAVSFAINRVLKSQLVGVSPADPVALAAASIVLVLSAAVGCWLPARRATRVDPAVALKYE